jgi:type II secretory pathway component GspD/PulD (secretin)
MKKISNIVFIVFLLQCSVTLAETTSIKIIELHSRTSTEIIPILKPLMDNNTAITGTGYQLIIRATPSKMAEIKGLLDKLDKTPLSLMISVKHGTNLNLEALNASISGQAKIGDDATIETGNNKISADGRTRIKIKIGQTVSRNNETSTSQIRVLEGNIAHIQTGKAIPLPERTVITNGNNVVTQDSVRYRDVTSGFYALPRVRGQMVTIDISPKKESLSKHGGGIINTQSMHTSVRGELGKWIDIGGVNEESRQESSGIIYKTRQRNENNYRIFIKIDEVQS